MQRTFTVCMLSYPSGQHPLTRRSADPHACTRFSCDDAFQQWYLNRLCVTVSTEQPSPLLETSGSATHRTEAPILATSSATGAGAVAGHSGVLEIGGSATHRIVHRRTVASSRIMRRGGHPIVADTFGPLLTKLPGNISTEQPVLTTRPAASSITAATPTTSAVPTAPPNNRSRVADNFGPILTWPSGNISGNVSTEQPVLTTRPAASSTTAATPTTSALLRTSAGPATRTPPASGGDMCAKPITCAGDEYLVFNVTCQACTPAHRCVTVTPCDPSTEYESRPKGRTTPNVCTPLTPCNHGQSPRPGRFGRQISVTDIYHTIP